MHKIAYYPINDYGLAITASPIEVQCTLADMHDCIEAVLRTQKRNGLSTTIMVVAFDGEPVDLGGVSTLAE